MRALRGNVFGLLVTLASFAAILALWDKLPDPMPTHWNWRGEIDGWTRKPWGPLLLPIAIGFVTGIFVIVEALTPKSVAHFERAYRMIAASVTAFLAVLGGLTTASALGAKVDVARGIGIAVGAMFVVMGNFFGKLTRNPWIGIRTPWTLASDEVWLRTHRFGGKVFVVAGLVSILGAALGQGTVALLVALVFASVASVVYSYFVHRRLARRS